MTTFAKRLRETREKAGMSQAQVAEHLHISRVSYTLYETGKNEPSLQNLNILADLFKVSIDYLTGRY